MTVKPTTVGDAGPLVRMRRHRLFISICGLSIGVMLAACSSRNPKSSTLIYGFSSRPAEFNLGDPARFEFKVGRLASDGDRRLVIAYEKYDRLKRTKLGEFFRVSNDNGTSFGPERLLPAGAAGHSIALAFTKSGVAAVFAAKPTYSTSAYNLFYTRMETADAVWSNPIQINDEQDSVIIGGGGDFSFIQPAENEAACVWIDRRRGYGMVFFSASQDGGRTWMANQLVEYDFREGQQSNPYLLRGAGGRLLAFWVDGRDRETLFDIRSSHSDDYGQHWSASQKINDDRAPVWQTGPKAVARGSQIYVAFEDFREAAEGGPHDMNIYFTASSDNGKTWKPNSRVNDVAPGADSRPALAIDEPGNLFCIWRSGRDNIFGEIYFAYSVDDGHSWSPSIRVHDNREIVIRHPPDDLITLSNGKLLCGWTEILFQSATPRLAWLEPLTAPPVEKTLPTREVASRIPPSFTGSKTIFADDFSSDYQSRWRVVAGVWKINDGTFMGVNPGAPFSSFANLKEPASYLLRGRFKLDPLHHQMAYIYFRANPINGAAYVIGNGFQTGACLSVKEDDSPRIYRFGPFVADGWPLSQRPFPFQNNHWYEFVLAVSPERVDYFVDDQWMLSYEGRLKLAPGTIGLGGFSSAPTYFDDIVVAELK